MSDFAAYLFALPLSFFAAALMFAAAPAQAAPVPAPITFTIRVGQPAPRTVRVVKHRPSNHVHGAAPLAHKTAPAAKKAHRHANAAHPCHKGRA